MLSKKSMDTMLSAELETYKKELQYELDEILAYWINNTVEKNGESFYGQVRNDNQAVPTAPKGIVLFSRILWTFSAAETFLPNHGYIEIAEKAFAYIKHYFIDKEYGGIFWSVSHEGNVLNSKKQIYGQAFCMYGMTEYFKATGSEKALQIAKDLFQAIEEYSFDKINGGYTEAFNQNWESIEDLRLSEKDSNEAKTMNTHLHIIEAYTNLYQVWPDVKLKEKIEGLLDIFYSTIINEATGHLNLFMTDTWEVKSSIQSFGHDIEAAWLLLESAEITGSELYIQQFKKMAISLTNVAMEGLDIDGGIWYEYNLEQDHWIKEKHWWPQAEAMIGFFNAFQISGDEKYLRLSLQSWQFIKKHIKDIVNGEWFWGVEENYTIMQQEKAGFWKCPYHNGRACIELIKRINLMFK